MKTRILARPNRATNLEHKHPDRLRRLNTDIAAECTNVVIEEIADEEFDTTEIPPQPTVNAASSSAGLPARGGEWFIDSGSSFDIISPSDMTAVERKRIDALDGPVPVYTAQGEAKATQCVSLTLFSDGTKVECLSLLMPHSPALLSLGNFCVESDCTFLREKGSVHG